MIHGVGQLKNRRGRRGGGAGFDLWGRLPGGIFQKSVDGFDVI